MNLNKLQNACEYVTENWLPVDAALLKQIQNGLSSGRYAGERGLLFHDLKKDFALFFYCLRRLAENSKTDAGVNGSWLNPAVVFDKAPLADFERILSLPPDRYSRHLLTNADQAQAKRLVEPVVSATVAETLARGRGFCDRLAYATAFFRELGLSLIAWNYPHIYRRAIAEPSRSVSLDETLSQVLGFSPSLLGVTMARNWSIAPEVRLAMGDDEASSLLDSDARNVGENMARLCTVGEALARVNSQEIYPNSRGEWQNASKDLARQIGADGVRQLQQVLVQNLSHYLNVAPALFKLPELLSASLATGLQNAAGVERRNKYVKSCPRPLAAPFEKLYILLQGGCIQKDAIDVLIQDIVLPAGFTGGCIFLLEPDSLTLVPRLIMGNCSAKNFKPLAYSSIVEQWNPVVAALRAAAPLIEEHDLDKDPAPCYVAGALGSNRRAGVLYLEMGSALMKDPMVNPLVCFKAIRQALNDLLNLE